MAPPEQHTAARDSAAAAPPLVVVPVDKRSAPPVEIPPGIDPHDVTAPPRTKASVAAATPLARNPAAKAPAVTPAPTGPTGRSAPVVPSAPVSPAVKSLTPRDKARGSARQPVVTGPAVQEPTAPPESLRPSRSIRVPRRHKARIRRVRRVVRSVDTWTVFKVSVPFYLAMYIIMLTAAVALWQVADVTHTVDNVENFLTNYGWETFQFKEQALFRATWTIGLFLAVAGVGFNVLLATLFNLIADLTGGIRLTVLEEEVRLVPRARVQFAESEGSPNETTAVELTDPTSELLRVTPRSGR